MTLLIRIDVPKEGQKFTKDYDFDTDRRELLWLIESYIISMREGESVTLSCDRRMRA